jgi:hypothetical protein
MLPIWLLSWAVLFPLTSVNTEAPGHPDPSGLSFFSGLSGIDRFMIGNIIPNGRGRYVGHLLLTWIFTSKIPGLSPCDGS